METTSKNPKLVAIVGPTASGKSALALATAELTPSEIICADSRTIYKGMSLGTAKPSQKDQTRVQHWGLDMLEPGQRFSAKQFKNYAVAKIEAVSTRESLPILVGGTGLYIDSVLYDFQFPQEFGSSIRAQLESLNVTQLQQKIELQGYKMPQNKLNKRHLIRTLERKGIEGSNSPLRLNTILIGILPTDAELRANIEKRAEDIFKQGVLDETANLIAQYGRDAVLSTGGIVYKICLRLLEGEINEQTAIRRFQTADWQYARRQKTWFKKNNDIRWFTDRKTAFLYLKTQLNT